MLGLLIFVYMPMLWSVYLSFFDARNTVTPTEFVGLANYAYLLQDQAFVASMGTFVVFAAFIVPLTFACSLGPGPDGQQGAGRDRRSSGRRSSCPPPARTSSRR